MNGTAPATAPRPPRVGGTYDWKSAFTDYLCLSFTNAISFSAGDVALLTRWAKLMMMLQSAISVAAIALVIARAVNILG